jgi:hypothetical protein
MADNREFMTLTSFKRLVIKRMCGALVALSVFIHAWPRNSLKQKNIFIQSKLKGGICNTNRYQQVLPMQAICLGKNVFLINIIISIILI